ncbi:polyketide synthase phosphopantetheine-binding HglE [Tolypothrix sp. NIES-4075]|uniref:type I polyketide synthase n=1 Tax=Tolypothrix sp. NIES-4075 TaxID=2005459 RepID=UPI000B5C99CB|nr:type I polyketide synthase [Tolypothrix sp. NIES-4075]GAX43408.1 polyketide synthase phosphopantetheine-binding HglE [Tolypothrix sp. NIES-4075]
MSAYSIDTALAQLKDQINNCERAVLKVIEEKKMKSENKMSINKINRQLQHNPIAIIGMASLFPQSRNLQEYWDNIVNKIDCITDVPASHWNIDEYYDPDPRTTKDKTYCKRGGFIPEVDFNPMEFGLPPNILEVTDVSQLLSLVIAKEAMEDANYSEVRAFNRENVGVVLGVAQGGQLAMPLAARLQYPVWEKVLKSSGLSDEDTQKIVDKIKSAYVNWNENAFPGMLGNVVAGRIANRLNFGGINCVVDAACASSFGALKLAISELTEHRSDMMLTGGVDLDNSVMAYISFSKTPAVSPGDKVKPFDAKSDGMMLGEGVGMILLKRLEDAERDNDKIYAVIKGIGTSSDGRYKSIYAPRLEGQVKALERAYEDAGFAPESIGLVEAHGTGTMAGDPTEFSSLKEFFGEDKKQHIALGSVKSQIGHTKAAAGAASLIKTALALHHKILPPTINITEPNPKLNIKNSAFYLNTQTRPWIRAEGEPPRRAGVSSFGFGGTNYHVVLEEHTAEHIRAYRVHNTPSEVVLFAETHGQLVSKCEEILGNLRLPDADKHYAALIEECKSTEIPLNAPRVGFVVDSLTQAAKLLQISLDCLRNRGSSASWEHPQGVYYRASGLNLKGKVVSLFSGQGSQYLEMGRELAMNFPSLRRLYGYMDSLLLKDNLQPLSEIVFPQPVFEEAEKNAQVAALQRTEYAQPAIGVLSAGMYKILQEAGFESDFVAGHSFGELTALWAAGVVSEEDYLYLVKARGQAMAAPQDPDHDAGAMLAVKEDISKVEAVLKHFPQVTIANQNSPNQVVLAGLTTEINKVRQALQDKGYAAVLLPVSAAFHTPLIAFAQKSFAIASKTVSFHSPQIPVFTNVTGKQYPQEPQAIHQVLESHLSKSVLFKQEIENIYAAGGYCFVEFGPRRILSNLVKDILGDRPHLAIALNPSAQKDSDRSLREAVVQLRVAGLSLKNLDPYQLSPEVAPTQKNKALNVRLNGTNYRSEKTKNAFATALQDGHQVTLPVSKSEDNALVVPVLTTEEGVEVKLEVTTPTPAVIKSNGHNKNAVLSNITTVETPEIQPAPSHPLLESHMPNSPEKPLNYQQVLESLEFLLTQFQQNQSENLQVHGTYLNHQMEYAKTFFQLMQQQNSVFANGNSSQSASEILPVLKASLERSMMQFHSQQGETLRIHEQYLKEQVEYTKSFFQLIQQEYAQLVGTGDSLLGTGDLGLGTEVTINPQSVVEVAAAKVVETPPQPVVEAPVAKVVETPQPVVEVPIVITPVTPPQPVVEVKIVETPPQPVVEAPAATVKVVETPLPVVEAPAVVEIPPQPVVEAPAVNVNVAITTQTTFPSTSDTSINLTELGNNLLAITSDKTGYPVEMLEMDMDMEADLGIDSIKRVEILGGLQEMYPDLPKPNLEELAEKRTIGQIVEYLQSHASQKVSVEIAIQEVQTTTEVPAIVIPEPVVTEIEVTKTVETIDASPASEIADLGATLLAITSDKTGYPVEMLELDMDMEADLGIDSIKRVEILGAMQEMYPDLPKPNVEELGDLRTIGQIVDYLQKLVGGEKKKFQYESDEELDNVKHNVQRRPVQLKILPPPDSLDFDLPEGHICLITDDGSLTTSQVAELLTDKGWKVVVLSFPQSVVFQTSVLPAGVINVKLGDLTEEHLQQQLSAIATNYGTIGAFIHLNPAFQVSHNGKIPYLAEEKAIVKHVFLIAKHLKKSLNEAARYGRSLFCTTARLDGAFGLEHKVNYGPISAGLFGLTKTLRWEWQKVFCRAIDLHPAISAQESAQHIIAELHDPNNCISEVGYGSQGRVTIVSVANC